MTTAINTLKNKIEKKGISLRVAHIIMTSVIAALTVALFVLTFYSASMFSELSTATYNYMEMQKNAEALMNASDYLTQEAQCYTITCDMEHLDNYFIEANQTKRREKAIKVLSRLAEDTEALHQLENAMNESVNLMDREYYTMLLILEATNNDYRPVELAELTLTPEDEKLSDEKKIELARNMMHDRTYYEKKTLIRSNMQNCLNELDEDIYAEQQYTDKRMKSSLARIRLLGVIQLVIVMLGLLVNKLLGIDPVVKSVQKVKDDDPLPITGATEFRYLAAAYNKMHEAMKEDISMLNFRASHDKLTGVYNRAGYEIISTSLDLTTTTMLLVDVDNFKSINDQYSHPVGDKVLQKLAKTLTEVFRSKDFVCRIGGDEFVVFLLNTDNSCENEVKNKIDSINLMLSDGSDDLPPISISVGCVIGEEDSDAQRMMKHADIALYKVKDNGKKGCCVYTHNIK